MHTNLAKNLKFMAQVVSVSVQGQDHLDTSFCPDFCISIRLGLLSSVKSSKFTRRLSSQKPLSLFVELASRPT